MDYAVYHDESQEAGYWHGILLVPVLARKRLLEALHLIRTNTGYNDVVSLKRLNKNRGRRYRCIRAWLHFGMVSLLQTLKGRRFPYYVGIERPTPEYAFLESPIAAKFILFRVRDGHQQLVGLPDHAAKIETTFRMGLKGGLHLFAGSPEQMRIVSLHFDGHEHYKRRIDRRRTVGRIGPLRENVCIMPTAQIYDDPSDHRKAASQSYGDCQLLQLTDLLVGGFRTLLGRQTHPSHRKAAEPLQGLIDRWHAGSARMRNSRWHGGFCISECYLQDGEWQFSDIGPRLRNEQASLPGLEDTPSAPAGGRRKDIPNSLMQSPHCSAHREELRVTSARYSAGLRIPSAPERAYSSLNLFPVLR